MTDSRLDLSFFPRKKSVWSTPSMIRSFGTLPSAMRANVGNKSISCTISLLTALAGTFPGHRIMKDTRKEASPGREVRAAPRPTETIVSCRKLGPVIGREDEDRVVADSKFVHRIEQLTDMRVDLGENVGEIAVVGFVLKVWGGDRWHVWLRIGNVGEERFLRPRLPAHKIDRTLG